MGTMTVITPGLLSTIQDEGRFGYMQTGFSPGGAMDSFALKLANILVGNAPGDGAVEMTMLGMTVAFDQETVVAVTGAQLPLTLNGKPVSMNESIPVCPGDVLVCGPMSAGMRSYLAVAGGFDLAPAMGSMSTNLKCGLGGFEGRPLKKGDRLPLRHSFTLQQLGHRQTTPPAYMEEALVLRVILGPQDDMFTHKGLQTFLSKTYTVSDKSDRMGIRLEGPAIENINGVDIISDGIATGSVQIPPAGTPIIMMADRQTTGGYAKIATVISADLKRIAQARPGSKLRFKAIGLAEALKLKKEEQTVLDRLLYKTYFAK